jgi:hypothetical protein
VFASALLLAGCGGSGSSGPGATKAASGAKSNPQLTLSECMRAHGVSNFPDPVMGPYGSPGMSVSTAPGSGTITVEGIAFSGPTFEAAVSTCKMFGGGNGPGSRRITASRKQQLVEFSQCMRRNGVPDYPDPVFPPGGGIERPVGSNIDTNSPDYQAAAARCNTP